MGNVYSLLQVSLKAIVGACLCSFYVFCVQNTEIHSSSDRSDGRAHFRVDTLQPVPGNTSVRPIIGPI